MRVEILARTPERAGLAELEADLIWETRKDDGTRAVT
jgi:hypothetical protein